MGRDGEWLGCAHHRGSSFSNASRHIRCVMQALRQWHYIVVRDSVPGTARPHLQRDIVRHDDFAADRAAGVVSGRRVQLGQQEAGLQGVENMPVGWCNRRASSLG